MINQTRPLPSLSRLLRAPAQFSAFPFATATALALIAIAALAALAATSPAARAQAELTTASHADPVELEAYVVSASRTERSVKLTPSSVTSIALSEMVRQQIPDLRSALQLIPGVNITETGGATGSKSALSIRGAGTNQTLFIIDGIRMNAEDWTSSYTGYLGSTGLGGLERIEVLRGAQSTLYGSAAMGGVITLETAHGRGQPAGIVALEAGSFDTLNALASVAGKSALTTALTPRSQTLSYSASLSTGITSNDRPFNDYKQLSGTTRIEYALDEKLTAGFTYRGATSRYEEPGPLHDPTQSGIRDLVVNIATAYIDLVATNIYNTRLTYGWVQNSYDWDSAYPSHAHSTRNVLDWQNNLRATGWLELVGGINTEWSHYKTGSDALSERLASLYLNAVAKPLKNLELTLGGRADDYSTLDAHLTWRAGAAYRIEKTNTTLRSTYGTGFNAPAPQYVIGGGWYLPSPGLEPEKSKGYDIGIEQDFWRDRITLGVAYYKNEFENKFKAVSAGGLYRYTNIPDATADGIEAYLYARLLHNLRLQLTYTNLDARDNNGVRLIHMPRNTLSGDINYQATNELLVGVGLACVTGRPDETYTTYDATWTPTRHVVKMKDYITVRAYASYAFRSGLSLKLRAENVLDKNYFNLAGYPALPFGLYGGIEWKF